MNVLSFHDNKLWQESFVVLMDIHEAFEEVDADGRDAEVVDGVLSAGQKVAAKIADSLSRTDRRIARELLFDAVGLVAVARTQLAIAWGRGLLGDDVFKGLDSKYATLTENLQRVR